MQARRERRTRRGRWDLKVRERKRKMGKRKKETQTTEPKMLQERKKDRGKTE